MAATDETIRRHLNCYVGVSRSISHYLSSKALYRAFLKINMNADIIDVPSILHSYIYSIDSNRTDTLVLPIYEDNNIYVSSFSTLLKKVYFREYNLGTLFKAVVKEDTFYATRGMILDRDYNPLMICTVRFTKEDFGLTDAKPVIYISPKVYNTTNIVTKAIISKVIPHYATSFRDYHFDEKPEIIISDAIDNFIAKPDNPDISGDIDKDLNDILKENIENIVERI